MSKIYLIHPEMNTIKLSYHKVNIQGYPNQMYTFEVDKPIFLTDKDPALNRKGLTLAQVIEQQVNEGPWLPFQVLADHYEEEGNPAFEPTIWGLRALVRYKRFPVTDDGKKYRWMDRDWFPHKNDYTVLPACCLPHKVALGFATNKSAVMKNTDAPDYTKSVEERIHSMKDHRTLFDAFIAAAWEWAKHREETLK